MFVIPKNYQEEFNFLLVSSQYKTDLDGYKDSLVRLCVKTYSLVGDSFSDVINLYRLRANSNFLDINLYHQCLSDIYCQNIPDHADAWEIVIKGINTYGRRKQPDFQHNLITKTVNSIGGWNTLCNSTDMTANRSNFYKIYKEQRKKYTEGIMVDALRD